MNTDPPLSPLDSVKVDGGPLNSCLCVEREYISVAAAAAEYTGIAPGAERCFDVRM